MNRYEATGPAKVIIVNAHREAACRFEAVAGPKIPCTWIPTRIHDWLDHE